MCTLAVLVLLQKVSERENSEVPTVKFYGRLIPNIFSRLRYNSNARTVIYEGYEKYKNAPYRLLKPDEDLLVIPNKYCEELRALPETKLNALEALFKNHVGTYTGILTGSHLHTDAIQRRLTPGLARVVPRVMDELRYAFEVELPAAEGKWVPVNLYDVVLRLVSRAGSRVFVGEAICRDEAWLDASITFSANIFETIAILRMLPGFLHPVVGKLLPSTRRLNKQLHFVKEELLVPIINKRRAAERSSATSYEKPDDFLQWMMDLADNEMDAAAGNLAHRLLGIFSMAVVHTSAMAIVHVLFDLVTMPEYLEPLRAEMQQMLPHGWDNATQSALTGMSRLDSFMRESQRVNPPSHLAFNRVVKEPITLSDGLQLPEETHICMPSGPIAMDNAIIPNANTFDGFRWYREKKTTATFVTANPTNLHWGMGRYACPGRFFASHVIKGILSRILLDYDFKFEKGQRGRPKNVLMGEVVLPDLSTTVLFRRRTEYIVVNGAQ